MTTTSETRAAEFNRAARFPHERQHEIYLLALRNGTVDVSELARQFDVTTETIRRDLSDLQNRQLVRRVHGGAVPVERQRHEPMVEARGALNGEQKLRIAQHAILQIPDQGSVIIDSGSTGQRLADVFPATAGVQVITNSLATALTLARRGVDAADRARRRGPHEHVRDGRRLGGRGGAHGCASTCCSSAATACRSTRADDPVP